MSCSFVRLGVPLGYFPARRSFLFSWRRNSRPSIFSGVYSKPFWFSTRARRARHILASPSSCVITRSPGCTRFTSAKSTLSGPLSKVNVCAPSRWIWWAVSHRINTGTLYFVAVCTVKSTTGQPSASIRIVTLLFSFHNPSKCPCRPQVCIFEVAACIPFQCAVCAAPCQGGVQGADVVAHCRHRLVFGMLLAVAKA